MLSVLGELEPSSVHTKMQLQRPEIRIRDPKTKEIVGSMTSDVPDLLSLHGSLQTSSQTQKDATLSVLFRRGQPFPGTPPLTWTINCEKGEVGLVSPSGTALHASENDEPVKIQIHHFDTDEIEDVPWEWSRAQEEVPAVLGRTVMSSLYSFADDLGKGEGKEGYDGWVGLEDAARRAAQIEGFLEEWSKNLS